MLEPTEKQPLLYNMLWYLTEMGIELGQKQFEDEAATLTLWASTCCLTTSTTEWMGSSFPRALLHTAQTSIKGLVGLVTLVRLLFSCFSCACSGGDGVGQH